MGWRHGSGRSGVLNEVGDLPADLGAVGLVVVAIVVGLMAHWLVLRLATHLSGRTRSRLDTSLIEHLRNPLRLLAVLGAVALTIPWLGSEAAGWAWGALVFLGIIGLGWLLVGLTLVGQDAMTARFPEDVTDLEARQIRTQVAVLQRFGSIIIWLVAVAVALLTLPGVQPLAASLLAGAGVVGIVLGIAAGPLIGNFIAGIQIALTQPIKIGDVVVINGEWGHIGEITSAYVVVYIWDKRRLIVPLSKIVNEPVENWTRKTKDLLGTVKLHLDYRAPIDEIRAEYKRILDDSGLWDGEAWSVLVTAADARTITVRALYSAPDAGVEWSLRCLVREKLITYLQQQHPEALPVAREIQYQSG
jgi:small-conductance mechanosensitive channel